MEREILHNITKKLRKYEIFIKKVLTTQRQGDFHSIFKGSGIIFDDIRQYQYGDDIRTIDWNASAKGHGTFVKTYREEREQQVYIFLDISASQEIGNQGQQKIDLGKEVSGVLALSALEESSKVGLLTFSDQKESLLKADKGQSHAFKFIKTLFDNNPGSLKTNLKKGFGYLLNLLKRRSIVFIISDFIDEDYWHNLKAISRKHDLIVIHLSDPRETNLPSLGIIPVIDKESGKTIWVNTGKKHFQQAISSNFAENADQLETFCHKHLASYLKLTTHEDYVSKLVSLFKRRNVTASRG